MKRGAEVREQEFLRSISGFLMVLDALDGTNAVEIVSLDSTSVPSCLTSLNPAVDLYEGCLTTFGDGNANMYFIYTST